MCENFKSNLSILEISFFSFLDHVSKNNHNFYNKASTSKPTGTKNISFEVSYWKIEEFLFS